MWKKIIAGLIIGIGIIALSSYGHAQKATDNVKVEQEVDLSKYQIIRPEKRAYSIEEKIDFINGIAPPGTTITIEVYGTTDLTRKNFNLLVLPSEEDYIEVYSDTIVSGNSGTFSKQLELVTGINKVIIRFGVEGVPAEEIIIYVNPKNNKEIKRPNNLMDLLIQH
ncbi:MAG: hypothetical protein GX077_03665 [Tissierellia bacterium]|nr:hypothetical protein [Tissierellia bacterium]